MRIKLLVTFLTLVTFIVFAAEEGKTPLVLGPVLKEIVPTGEVTKNPARYPIFKDHRSDNSACDNYLMTMYDGKNIGDKAMKGLSLAPVNLKSKYGNGKSVYSADSVNYEDIADLYTSIDFKNTYPAYKKSSKILITWTVRIEGRQKPINIWPKLCGFWHGTSYQEFPEGQVKTALFISKNNSKWEKVSEAVMTIPSAGQTKVVQFRDPTNTGSYLLTPDKFGGEFPNILYIKVGWFNDTSMELVSPSGERNLIINIIPVSE